QRPRSLEFLQFLLDHFLLRVTRHNRPLVDVERQRTFFCPTFCGELLRALGAFVGETDFQCVTVEFVDSDRGLLPVIYGDRSIVRPGLLARIYGQRSLERRAPDTDG